MKHFEDLVNSSFDEWMALQKQNVDLMMRMVSDENKTKAYPLLQLLIKIAYINGWKSSFDMMASFDVMGGKND